MSSMRKFSDFARNSYGFVGNKIPITDLLNKDIIVKAYRIISSKVAQDKDCLQLQIEFESEPRVTFTNSIVLIKQAKEYESEMPFSAKIIKNGNYYTFS